MKSPNCEKSEFRRVEIVDNRTFEKSKFEKSNVESVVGPFESVVGLFESVIGFGFFESVMGFFEWLF